MAALARARALGAPLLPLTGALEQLAEIQRYLLDRSSPLPSLLDYVEYVPSRKKKREPIRRWKNLPESAWDPDPIEQQIQVSRCRACLLEILRRAAHDWVLYRTHSELEKRQIAEHAHTWLFEEGPGHSWWRQRHQPDGQVFTSFLNICEVLDLDPTFVRQRIRRLTPREIMTAGRPAERRGRSSDEVAVTEHEVVEMVSLDELDEGDNYPTSYERQFAVNTPGYL